MQGTCWRTIAVSRHQPGSFGRPRRVKWPAAHTGCVLQVDRVIQRRTVSALLVVTIHLVAIQLILTVDRQPVTMRVVSEIFSTLVLPPLPELVRPPQMRPTPLPTIALPSVTLPPSENAPFALAPVAPFAEQGALGDSYVLGALGEYFACNMANYDKLSPEEKARCAPQLTQRDLSMPYVPTLHEHQLQVVFAREFARKKAPLLLPCMPGGTDPKHGFLAMGMPDNSSDERAKPVIGITIGQIICLANGAIDGFDPDTSTTYADYPYDSDVGAAQ